MSSYFKKLKLFNLTAKMIPFSTATPTLLRRVCMEAIELHSCTAGSYFSAVFNPVDPSKPPTWKKKKCLWTKIRPWLKRNLIPNKWSYGPPLRPEWYASIPFLEQETTDQGLVRTNQPSVLEGIRWIRRRHKSFRKRGRAQLGIGG